MPGPQVHPASDEQVRRHVAAAKPHTLVLLKAGPKRDQPPAEVAQIQTAHLRHLVGLAEAGELLVNGPVLDETSDVCGMSLYRSFDHDLVQAWAAADPAVVAGRLTAHVLPWFGALPGDQPPGHDQP
jgi:uncharacterized protein